MSALRFVAGIGAGAAIAALVVGATVGAPTAAEPEVAAQAPRSEPKPATPSAAPATAAAKKADVQRGVLARAAASRRPKGAAGDGHAPGGGKDAKGAKDAVIESVEVDWGASQARP